MKNWSKLIQTPKTYSFKHRQGRISIFIERAWSSEVKSPQLVSVVEEVRMPLIYQCASDLFLAAELMLSHSSICFYNLAVSLAFPTNPRLLGWSQAAQKAVSVETQSSIKPWEPENMLRITQQRPQDK